MSPTKKENPKGNKVNRIVSFPLNDEEVSKLGHKAAKLEGEIESLEEKKKAEAKKWNDDIKSKRKTVRKIAKEITSGKQDRDVECTEVKNFDTKKVEYWHEGAVVQERAMTEADKQLNMEPLPGAKGPKRTGKLQAVSKGSDKKETKEEARSRDINEVRKAETSKNPAAKARELQ